MPTVAEHLGIAELLGGLVTPGHFYNYTNDQAHFNHVHVAFNIPWGDGNRCSDPGAGSLAAMAYRAAFEQKFGNKYAWGGTYVCKFRAGTNIISQHAVLLGNAVDYMALGAAQDPIIEWINGPWEGGDDDVLTKFESRALAYIAGADERRQGNARPDDADKDNYTGSDGTPHLAAAQRGYDMQDGKPNPAVK